jgi:UDP-3-O-[3-hydroxymyristoyl] glucosamine N-acyltransferase
LARLVREAYTSRRAMKPVSLDEAGSKIDNQIQIGHNMTVGGYC